MKRLFAAGLLLAAFFAASAGPASGHAVLEGSSPPRGAELAEAPSEVNFTFNEPVEASLGAVRVFDTEGNEVQDGELERPGGSAEVVGATLPDDLRDGIYTATYQVVSADSHPISGGITFTVGNPESGGAAFVQGKTISELLAQNEAGKVTEVAFWADRWIGYLLPLTYFISISQGIMLRAAPLSSLWPSFVILGVMAVAVFGAAILRFRSDLAPNVSRNDHVASQPDLGGGRTTRDADEP